MMDDLGSYTWCICEFRCWTIDGLLMLFPSLCISVPAAHVQMVVSRACLPPIRSKEQVIERKYAA